tara:strand:- start:97 stop:369 length:273 start_codon:yes stop_codon:yes gene_type:complete
MLSKVKSWINYWFIEKPVDKVVEEVDTAEEEGKDIYGGNYKADEPVVRKRTIKGKFVADDPSTPDVNEAWVGGKAPAKKSKTKVIRKKSK